jgi:hypothetical protein
MVDTVLFGQIQYTPRSPDLHSRRVNRVSTVTELSNHHQPFRLPLSRSVVAKSAEDDVTKHTHGE